MSRITALHLRKGYVHVRVMLPRAKKFDYLNRSSSADFVLLLVSASSFPDGALGV
jgi:hypothetical protein